jgi:hypothetical protein
MKRYTIDAGIPTLEIALAEHMSAEGLRLLAALTRTFQFHRSLTHSWIWN